MSRAEWLRVVKGQQGHWYLMHNNTAIFRGAGKQFNELSPLTRFREPVRKLASSSSAKTGFSFAHNFLLCFFPSTSE